VSDQEEGESVVLREEGSPVRVLTLNRPTSRNALDGDLHEAVLVAIRNIAAEPDVRAVVLTGAGNAFSAGGDFGLIQKMQDDMELRQATLERSRSLFKAVLELDIPVVAAVNGPAVGAGATLALLCDIVLMADDAYLAEPRVVLGLVAGDGGATLWPLLAGVPAARAYLLTGDRMSAQEAHRLGLIYRVVSGDLLVQEAIDLAERLAGFPAYSIQATKRALNLQVEAVAQTTYDFAMSAESDSFDTPELHALVRARTARRQQAGGKPDA
jgi:enoyl-CoA hydratase